MDTETVKKQIVHYFMEHKALINGNFLSKLNEPQTLESIYMQVQAGEDPTSIIEQNEQKNTTSVKVVSQYQDFFKKWVVQDFVDYFNSRFTFIEKLLQTRNELKNLTSISRLQNKRERETVSIIAIVSEKGITKNGNIVLTVEDKTGSIKVIITKQRPDVFISAQNIVLDEVIGLVASTGDGVLFANSVVIPDVPLQQTIKHAQDEVYAVVISDIHIGSKYFLEKEFKQFIAWLRGEIGTPEQKEISQKVKYIFVVGDIVDGVGIYPAQEKELAITNITEQYNEAANLFSLIPKHMQIILGPGNHDAGRISEPQQHLSKTYSSALWKLPNITMVRNPSTVNIHSSKSFQGFNFLLYHGYSYDDYGEMVPSIKQSGKNVSDRTPLIMKFLLQRRHLAPTHTSTLYIPDPRSDPLVIQDVPDFFISGHIHKAAALLYRGVQIVCGSCWQAKTAFQEKVGHEPEPCKVPVINLQTRDITMMSFSL